MYLCNGTRKYNSPYSDPKNCRSSGLRDDEFVEIVNGRTRQKFKELGPGSMGPCKSKLESGQRLESTSAKEIRTRQTALNSAVELNDIAGNVTLKDDTERTWRP